MQFGSWTVYVRLPLCSHFPLIAFVADGVCIPELAVGSLCYVDLGVLHVIALFLFCFVSSIFRSDDVFYTVPALGTSL